MLVLPCHLWDDGIMTG